ncbi:MAG: DUF3418 domain-containing protein [Gammaproteobacteria bacterium]|nr:DUF3418 domain-containing protein [Gammaproteobacteria bacterium]
MKADLETVGLENFPAAGVAQRRIISDRGAQLVVFPTLVDRGDRVDLVMAKTRAEQQALAPRGYTRLVLIADRQATRYMRRQVKEQRTLGLHFAALGTAEVLCEEVLHAATWHCFFADVDLPGDAVSFRARLTERHGQWMPVFQQVVDAAARALAMRFDVVKRLDAQTSVSYAGAVSDIRVQLANLMPPDFLSRTPLPRLADLPRYLEAMIVRLDGLQGKVARDAESTAVVQGFVTRLERLMSTAIDGSAGTEVRFLIEELRIAVFAQRMGTRLKISPKRLDEHLSRLEVDAGLR